MTTLTFSQGIVSHSTTTGLPGGAQNFLVINSDKVDLRAPVDQPLVTIFSHRDTNYLLTLEAGADIQAWGYGATGSSNEAMDNINGGGLGTNEHYLWIDINRATGATTYGYSIHEPTSGSTPPFANIDRPDGQHWYDTTTRTMKVWRATGVSPYGTWTEVVRLFVAKYVFSSSFTSLSVNAPSYIGTTVGLVGQFRAGSLIYDVIGNPVLRTDSNNVSVFFTTEDVFTSGLPANASPVAGNRARYETFLVDAIGLSPAASHTIVKFNDFEKVLPLDALSQPNALWGLIEFPIASSGDLIQVTLSGVVRNPAWNWTQVGQQIFVDKDNDGVLTTVEGDGYVPLPNQLPVGVAIARTALLLRRPELALTTGASGGGVNDHNLLLNIGVNSHADIDTHISNSTIHQPQLDIGSPIGSVIDHEVLQNIGTNSHVQIDSHISNSTIHQPLTVEDVLGSPITSVGNVNTIQFNNSSGFDVVDQTGGVVRIDFNSAFNPFSIAASGGSTGGDSTMTASGEEEFRFIAGSNITLTGNNASSPKSITISSTGGGGGGGSPIVIPSRIQDSDNDTFVDTQYTGSPPASDTDRIRAKAAAGDDGYGTSNPGGSIDIVSGKGGDNTNLTFGQYGGLGGDINILAGQGGYSQYGSATGGNINITAGKGGTVAGGGTSYGGNVNITSGAEGDPGSSIGGDIVLTVGTSANPGSVILVPGQASGLTGARLEMRDASGNSANYISFQVPASVSGDQQFTLPTNKGTSGQVLTTAGPTGVLSWTTVSGGTSSRIQDGDNDTFVDTQFSAGSPGDTDPDHIRLETATSSAYSPFGGRIDIGAGTGSYGGVIDIRAGTLNVGTGTSPYISQGAYINLNAAVNDRAGGITLSGGLHEAYNVGGGSIYIGGGDYDNGVGGTITITAGPGQTGISPLNPGYGGGEVQIYGGDSSYTNAGDVKIYGGNHLAGGEFYGGNVAIRGGTTSGSGSTRGNVSLQGGRVFISADGQGGFVEPVVVIDSINTSSAPKLAFREREGLGSSTVSLKAPDSVTSSVTLTLPGNVGTPGQVLTTDGSSPTAILSWTTAGVGSPSGGGTPGGADTQVQYNDSGSFGGDAGMTYNDGTNALTVTGTITGNVFEASSGGAAGLKAFRFSSSTNRGMYYDGSNVVIANSGSNEGLRIESNGTLNVGGTTTYENLVTSDDDIPNRKFVTDRDVPYDITVPLPGPIGSSPKRVFTFIAVRAFTLISGVAAHRAHCITGPNSGGSPAFVRFSVYHDVGGDGAGVVKIGDAFFTVAGGNNQIDTFGTGTVSVAVNDVIYIDYEKVDDGTLADVSITLQATADII